MRVQNQQRGNIQRSKTPIKGTAEYEEYLRKLRLLEQIRLRKLKALEELSKFSEQQFQKQEKEKEKPKENEENFINDFDQSRRLRLDYVQQTSNNLRDITPKRVAFKSKDNEKTQNKKKKVKNIGKENINISGEYDYGNLKSNTEKKREDEEKRINEEEVYESEEEIPYESNLNTSSEIEESQEEVDYPQENISGYNTNRSNILSSREVSQQYHLTSINSIQNGGNEYQENALVSRRIMMGHSPLPPSTPNHPNFYNQNVQKPIPKSPYEQFSTSNFAIPGDAPFNQVQNNYPPGPYNFPQSRSVIHPSVGHEAYHHHHLQMKANYPPPTPLRDSFIPQQHVNFQPHDTFAPHQYFFPAQEPAIFQTHKSLLTFQESNHIKQEEVSARSKLFKMREKMKKKMKMLKKKKKRRKGKKRKRGNVDSSSENQSEDSSMEENSDSDIEESDSEEDSSYERKREEYLKKKRRKKKKKRGIRDQDKVFKETIMRIEQLQKMNDVKIKEVTSHREREIRRLSEKKNIEKRVEREDKRESLVPFDRNIQPSLSKQSACSMIEKFKKNLEKLHQETEDPLTSESVVREVEKNSFVQKSSSNDNEILFQYQERRLERKRISTKLSRKELEQPRLSDAEISNSKEEKEVNGEKEENYDFSQRRASSRYPSTSNKKQNLEQKKLLKENEEEKIQKRAPIKLEFDFSNPNFNTSKAPQAFEVPLDDQETDFGNETTLADAFKNKKQSMMNRLKQKKTIKKEKREITFDKYELYQKRKKLTKNPRSISRVKETKPKEEITQEIPITTTSKSPIKLPPNHIMERLAKGGKSKVSKKEMYELNKRLRNKLPEVKKQDIEKKRREDFRKRQAKLKAFNKSVRDTMVGKKEVRSKRNIERSVKKKEEKSEEEEELIEYPGRIGARAQSRY